MQIKLLLENRDVTGILLSARTRAGLPPPEGGRVITPPRSVSLHSGSTVAPWSPAAPQTVHILCTHGNTSTALDWGHGGAAANPSCPGGKAWPPWGRGQFTTGPDGRQKTVHTHTYETFNYLVQVCVFGLWEERNTQTQGEHTNPEQEVLFPLKFEPETNTTMTHGDQRPTRSCHLTERSCHVILQYLRCSQEPVAHSPFPVCQAGRHTCTLCRTEPVVHCWDMGNTGRNQTHPGTATGPSSGGASL